MNKTLALVVFVLNNSTTAKIYYDCKKILKSNFRLKIFKGEQLDLIETKSPIFILFDKYDNFANLKCLFDLMNLNKNLCVIIEENNDANSFLRIKYTPKCVHSYNFYNINKKTRLFYFENEEYINKILDNIDHRLKNRFVAIEILKRNTELVNKIDLKYETSLLNDEICQCLWSSKNIEIESEINKKIESFLRLFDKQYLKNESPLNRLALYNKTSFLLVNMTVFLSINFIFLFLYFIAGFLRSFSNSLILLVFILISNVIALIIKTFLNEKYITHKVLVNYDWILKIASINKYSIEKESILRLFMPNYIKTFLLILGFYELGFNFVALIFNFHILLSLLLLGVNSYYLSQVVCKTNPHVFVEELFDLRKVYLMSNLRLNWQKLVKSTIIRFVYVVTTIILYNTFFNNIDISKYGLIIFVFLLFNFDYYYGIIKKQKLNNKWINISLFSPLIIITLTIFFVILFK